MKKQIFAMLDPSLIARQNMAPSLSSRSQLKTISAWILCIIFINEAIASSTTQQQQQQVKKQIITNHEQSSDQNNPVSSNTSIDELLGDTMALLDNLDKKINNVNNKTPNSLMRDNLRLLDESLMAKDLLSDLHGQSTDETGDFTKFDEAAIEEALVRDISKRGKSLLDNNEDEDSIKAGSKGFKRARQISFNNQINQQSLASDSTERHIKFTLDLMHSIFASQGYTAKNSNSIESFLISPFSIQMVLMLMHLGSRGATRREINQCLHLNSLDPDSSILPAIVANSPTDESDAITHQYSTPEPKLKRRQGSIAQTASNNIKNHLLVARSQPKQPVVSADAAHELFGSAMKNLFKDKSIGSALTSANKIFLQKNLSLSKQYDWAIKHYYSTEIKQVDFQHQTQEGSLLTNRTQSIQSNTTVVNPIPFNISNGEAINKQPENLQFLINDWVERQTKGKISNFLTSPVPTSTLLMAINVIFFKGDWQFKFDPADTESDAWFTQANGKTTKVPMMVNRLPLAFAHNAQMKTSVIELPYKAQRLGLFLLLPDEISGIFNTMSMLNSTSFANLIASMRKPAPSQDQTSGAINVRIPKFSIESSPKLSQVLSQQMGLKTLFSHDLADLSGMLESKKSLNSSDFTNHSPGVDELIHKAILQVDEQGSVAAATSATIVERVGLFNGNYFEADHPFLLFLMDKQTGLVLFSGVYAGPNSSESDSNKTNKD